MKIGGKKYTLPKPRVIVIPRDEEGDIVFMAQVVLDYAEFDAKCPAPKPPLVTKRDKSSYQDFEDPRYIEKIHKLSQLRYAWLILKSLSATPELEWEKVNIDDPDTWLLYEEEFKESGLNDREVAEVIRGVMEANSMDDSRFKEARDRFSRSQADKPLQVFHPDEQ